MIPDLYNTPWLIEPNAMALLLALADRRDVPKSVLKGYRERRQHAEECVEASRGEKLRERSDARVRDGVAVIQVRGPIIRHADLFEEMSGATSLESLALDLSAAMNIPDVRGVLLNVDSPGGEANGIAEFAKMVRAADAKKPVTAYSGGMAASAAYWIAAAAGETVLGETASAGSIGVVAEYLDKTEMEAKLGLKRGFVVSDQSPKKRLDPATDEGQAQVKARVNELAGMFVRAVAEYRGVDEAMVLAEFGQGGLLFGRKAVSAGMADRIGTFEGVLRDLKRGRPRPKMAGA